MKKKPTNNDKKPFSIKDLPSLPDDHPLFTRGFVIGGRGFNRPRTVKNKQNEKGTN
jgi:hypothetical protein